jgi:hypothetical protein
MDVSLRRLSGLCECRDFSDGWKPPGSFPPGGREKPIKPQGCNVRHIRLLGHRATAPSIFRFGEKSRPIGPSQHP